jgi:hypothetical protein
MVVDHRTGKFREHEIFEHMMELSHTWNAWVWGIEAVAAQRVLIPFFQILLATKLLNHGVEMIPLMAGKGDPKVARIKSWVSLMAKNEYAVYEGAVEITTQLLNYSMKKKSNRDDLIDSCAYGPQILLQYEGLLVASYMQGGLDPVSAKYGMEIAGV